MKLRQHPKIYEFGDNPGVVFCLKPACKVEVGKGSYSSRLIPITIFSSEEQKLTIGKYVSISGGVKIIMAGGHNPSLLSTYPFKELMSKEEIATQKYGYITIGNDVWIGQDVALIGGCTIGDGVVVGAESLVTSKQHLEDYGVYGGNPAKLLRYRFSEQIIKELVELKWWNLSEKIIKENMELFYLKNIQEAITKLKTIKHLEL